MKLVDSALRIGDSTAIVSGIGFLRAGTLPQKLRKKFVEGIMYKKNGEYSDHRKIYGKGNLEGRKEGYGKGLLDGYMVGHKPSAVDIGDVIAIGAMGAGAAILGAGLAGLFD
ncbi:MAG: hypothetical protein Pg6C_05910 [Treponemataceae bacterium]|nr:MAG: hypothetical protein Pg6C_05910 [Treponemataceae bacterium]